MLSVTHKYQCCVQILIIFLHEFFVIIFSFPPIMFIESCAKLILTRLQALFLATIGFQRHLAEVRKRFHLSAGCPFCPSFPFDFPSGSWLRPKVRCVIPGRYKTPPQCRGGSRVTRLSRALRFPRSEIHTVSQGDGGRAELSATSVSRSSYSWVVLRWRYSLAPRPHFLDYVPNHKLERDVTKLSSVPLIYPDLLQVCHNCGGILRTSSVDEVE